MTAVELPEPVALERPPVDWERHKGSGAPKILPPPGAKWMSATGKTRQRHRYYTRVTTYADAISDQYNLNLWRMRRVALGLGQRPDYVRLASALTDRDEDRDALDELVGKALEAAGPNKADEGTALHALTERVDRGEDLGNPPPELVPDLTAYEVLSGELFRFAHREARTVCDQLECAGTPDGHAVVGELPPTGWGPVCDCPPDVLRIVDTKTGSVRYPAKMAIQLAIYAHSDLYDPATGERIPIAVCPHWGVIVHLAVESGLAAPFWLDLERGWRGAELCGPVREWNKLKADEILVPFEARPVQVDAAGTIERPDPRLASHKPGGTPAPLELTDLSEALAASIVAVRAERVPVDERCELSGLLVGECACKVHRPDLADVGDDGVQPEPGLTELDVEALASGPDSDAEDEPDPLPDRCAHSGERFRGDDGRMRCRDCGEPLHGDPLVDELLGAHSVTELELLWQRRRKVWTPAHLKLASERFGALKAEQAAEKPRAAFLAAVATVRDRGELLAVMTAALSAPWMTPELEALAAERWAQVAPVVHA